MLANDFAKTLAKWNEQRVVNEMQRVDRLDKAREIVEKQLVNSTQAVIRNMEKDTDSPLTLQTCLAVQEQLNKSITVSDKTLKTTLECMGYNPNEIPIEAETKNEYEQMDEASRGRIVDAATTVLAEAQQAVQIGEVKVDGETGEVLEN